MRKQCLAHSRWSINVPHDSWRNCAANTIHSRGWDVPTCVGLYFKEGSFLNILLWPKKAVSLICVGLLLWHLLPHSLWFFLSLNGFLNESNLILTLPNDRHLALTWKLSAKLNNHHGSQFLLTQSFETLLFSWMQGSWGGSYIPSRYSAGREWQESYSVSAQPCVGFSHSLLSQERAWWLSCSI